MFVSIEYVILLLIFLLSLLMFIIYLIRKIRRKNHHEKVTIAQHKLVKKDIQLIKNKLLLEEYNEHIKLCIALIDKQHDINKSQLNKLKKQLIKIYNIKHPLLSIKKNGYSEPENNLSDILKKTYPNLTDKEIDICLYAIAGLSSKEIAIKLNLRTQTINNYRRSIRSKLKIKRKQTLGKTLRELITVD